MEVSVRNKPSPGEIHSGLFHSMFYRDWRRDLAFGLTFLIVLIGGGVGLVALWNEQPNAAEKAQYAALEQAQRDNIIASCYRLPFDRQEMCVYQAFQTERDTNRAEEDVGAQQYMAKAGFWLWLVGWMQALAAVGGIYYIARTLDLTADTAKAAVEANDLMRAEQRPWLSVELERVVELLGKSDAGQPGRNLIAANIKPTIENFGKTPTLAAREYFEIQPIEPRFGNAKSLDDFVRECIAKFTSDDTQFVYRAFPEKSIKLPGAYVIASEPYDPDLRPPSIFEILCCVVYKSGNDSTVSHTATLYLATRSSAVTKFLSGDIKEISANETEMTIMDTMRTSVS